jgi:hypothetical protein
MQKIRNILVHIIELMPERFPFIASVVSGTVFYFPAFLKAYKSAVSKDAQSIMIALLCTICVGSFFVLLFNGFLLGWFVLLSKSLSKQQHDIRPIKKLVYAIALSQPFLFAVLMLFYQNTEFDMSLFCLTGFWIILIVLIRISSTLLWIQTRLKFGYIRLIMSLLPFVDCWGMLLILLNNWPKD